MPMHVHQAEFLEICSFQREYELKDPDQWFGPVMEFKNDNFEEYEEMG